MGMSQHLASSRCILRVIQPLNDVGPLQKGDLNPTTFGIEVEDMFKIPMMVKNDHHRKCRTQAPMQVQMASVSPIMAKIAEPIL